MSETSLQDRYFDKFLSSLQTYNGPIYVSGYQVTPSEIARSRNNLECHKNTGDACKPRKLPAEWVNGFTTVGLEAWKPRAVARILVLRLGCEGREGRPRQGAVLPVEDTRPFFTKDQPPADARPVGAVRSAIPAAVASPTSGTSARALALTAPAPDFQSFVPMEAASPAGASSQALIPWEQSLASTGTAALSESAIGFHSHALASSASHVDQMNVLKSLNAGKYNAVMALVGQYIQEEIAEFQRYMVLSSGESPDHLLRPSAESSATASPGSSFC